MGSKRRAPVCVRKEKSLQNSTAQTVNSSAQSVPLNPPCCSYRIPMDMYKCQSPHRNRKKGNEMVVQELKSTGSVLQPSSSSLSASHYHYYSQFLFCEVLRTTCLCICLCVRLPFLPVCPLKYLNNYTPRFHLIFSTCYLWPWRGPPQTAMQYAMYIRFYG